MPLRFGPFVLDVAQRLLWRDGVPVHIAPKAFEVLALLVAQRPRAVPKDEILTAVWKDVFVTDSTLSTAIRDVRAALDDDADAPRFVRTAYAFGYAFVAEVHADGGGTRVAGSPAAWCLVGEDRVIVLPPGVTVIGRSATGTGHVAISHPTISRRHALLTATDVGVLCEDLDSKNGTWVAATRVTVPVVAREGDAIRFGTVVAVLRRRDPATTEMMVRPGQ